VLNLPLRPPRAVVLLGLAAFCCFLGEGAAADWSAVYLVHSTGAAQAVAALGYTTFSLAMVASRLLGDRASRRAGPGTLVRAGALVAAGGLAAALALGSVPVGLLGFAAMGAGLGVVVPVLFRAAGGVPGISQSAAIAAVSTIGWLGFLSGPPLIGLVSGLVGLRSALWLVVAAALLLARLAPRDRAVERAAPTAARA
jgi:MFS family permease